MNIRPLTPADALAASQHRYPDLPADHPAVAAYAAWLPGALERGLYLGWVAEQGGSVVAGAGLMLLEWRPPKDDPAPLRGRVVNVWTHPDWRRRGLARKLVTQALDAAEAQGIRVVSLSATEMSRPLYESLGFEAYPAEMLRRNRSS